MLNGNKSQSGLLLELLLSVPHRFLCIVCAAGKSTPVYRPTGHIDTKHNDNLLDSHFVFLKSF